MIARFTRKGEEPRIFHNADIYEGYLVTFKSEGKYVPLWDSPLMSPKDREVASPIKDVRIAIKKGLSRFLIKAAGTENYTVEDITVDKIKEKQVYNDFLKSVKDSE